MRPATTRLLAALAPFAVACGGVAHAQDRPPLTPTRDVSVTYRVTGQIPGQPPGGSGPHEMRMSWLASASKLRIDPPASGPAPGYMLIDRANSSAVMVMDSQRMVMELPAQQANGQSIRFGEPSPSARFTRGGTASVAGQNCTEWTYQDGSDTGQACITADGVLLRGSGSRNGSDGRIEATAVQYGAQDPARFQVPPGYRAMNMGQLLRNLPGGTGALSAPPAR